MVFQWSSYNLSNRKGLVRQVHNWAQAVSSAEQAGASAVVVFNDLDAMEPFRMGLFGEKLPNIPAFMVSGKDGLALCASKCDLLIVRWDLGLRLEKLWNGVA